MKQINVKGLSNALLESVGRDIQTSKEGIDFTQEEINELAYVYDPFYTELQAVIKAEQFKEIYNEKAALNKDRSLHYSGIKAIAKGNSYEDDCNKSLISNGLLNIFKKHDQSKKGGSYEMQSTKISSVIGEIEGGFTTEQLDSIGFTNLYEELKQKHIAFKEFMVKHNTEIINMLEKDTVSQMKNRYINSLDIFVNTVTFISNKTSSDNYIKLVNAIERIVNKAHIDAKAKHQKPTKELESKSPLKSLLTDEDRSESTIKEGAEAALELTKPEIVLEAEEEPLQDPVPE